MPPPGRLPISGSLGPRFGIWEQLCTARVRGEALLLRQPAPGLALPPPIFCPAWPCSATTHLLSRLQGACYCPLHQGSPGPVSCHPSSQSGGQAAWFAVSKQQQAHQFLPPLCQLLPLHSDPDPSVTRSWCIQPTAAWSRMHGLHSPLCCSLWCVATQLL